MAGSSSRRKSGNSKSTAQWFGINRWIIILGAIVVLLIVLFVPMFSAIKVVEVKETVMVTVQKQVPETVTEDVATKVYVGYLQEQGQSYTTYAYTPPVVIISGMSRTSPLVGASADTGHYVGPSYSPSYGPSYNTYGSSGRRYQVDVSDEIVSFQQANGPDGSLTMTLTKANGDSTVYRYINQYDLTKTGVIKIPTVITRMKTVSEQEPQQVTKEQIIPINVNLIQLLSANLREQ